jgi:hypothetical protein
MTIEFRRGTGCALLSPIGRGAYHDAMDEEVLADMTGAFWQAYTG